MVSLKAVQNGQFSLDQDVNTILTSWKLPEGPFTTDRRVTPRSLMSHTSGTGDGFWFPGYAPGATRPSIPQILDGVQPPSNLRAVRLERAPLVGFKYSGARCDSAARHDGRRREAVRGDRPRMGPGSDRHDQQHVRAAIGSTSRETGGASARSHGRAHGRSVARLSGAGRCRLWTTPADLARFAIEVQQSLLGKSNRVLSQTTAREMVTPVGVGPYAVGFQIAKEGEDDASCTAGATGASMRPHRASCAWLRGGHHDER